MIVKHENSKTKPFEQFSVVQTKRDEQLIKYYTNTDDDIVCSMCGREITSFEAIIKSTVMFTPDKKIEEIKNCDIMLIKPNKCPFCGNSIFIKTFIVNEAQRIN